MTTTGPLSSDLLREVIREVVREVIREVVAEEVAAAALTRSGTANPSVAPARRSSATPSPAGSVMTRGALTERHVRAAGPRATISIGRAVVITPLAKERAKAMGVEIIRIEE